jgi:hypothetical protein
MRIHTSGKMAGIRFLDWQLAISNPSKLCPSQNCVFQLEGGEMGSELTPGERS